MGLKDKFKAFHESIDEKFKEQFGFRFKETNFQKIVEYLHQPKDASSLAVTRILFGIAMLFDIPDERGGAIMDRRWGNPYMCHFPLISVIRAVSMPYMALVYAALWLGALGIALGYKYRISSVVFTVCYWYLFLIDKSYWNNHSYLFGLVGLLLTFTRANCYWSLDSYLDPSKAKETVPYWNYFILKYQFFILYFMAGMKKGTTEWLTGYSVQNLSEHWVFDPFKLFLSVQLIDYLIVHWFIFMFDLTVAIWMMYASTRHIAMVFCALFHLMNSRLFRIGMFPWVCLATMPLYYPFDWPKTVLAFAKKWSLQIRECLRCHCNYHNRSTESEDDNIDYEGDDETDDEVFEEAKTSENCDHELEPKEGSSVTVGLVEENIRYEEELKKLNEMFDEDKEEDKKENKGEGKEEENVEPKEEKGDNMENKAYDAIDDPKNVNFGKKLRTFVIILYVLTQLFLPYSHFITKGYNNWTDGLYGYSWDMMVHTWDVDSVVVKVRDNENNQEQYIDHTLYSPNYRWTRHGDMAYQFAHCLKNILQEQKAIYKDINISDNISIYMDVWCSMNGRFSQRLFDPKVDILQASWSPFSRIPFLMPLLDEALHWRSTLQDIAEEVRSLSSKGDVVFLADFPNYEQTKFIPSELYNVTLTILEGEVAFETDDTNMHRGYSIKVSTGKHVKVESGVFHTVRNIGETPAYFMYTYFNETKTDEDKVSNMKAKLPIALELLVRFQNMVKFCAIVTKSMSKIIFGCNEDC